MDKLPTDKKELARFSTQLIEQCRASSGARAAYCRYISTIVETGSDDSNRSLINRMYSHVDRLASHLFSPTDLRFTIDFEREYPKNILDRTNVVGRILTKDWANSQTDMEFSRGVFESLKYGASILKQWVQTGADGRPVYHKSLVMPWQFAVYREDVNDLSRQYAMVETTLMSLPEVWRRISHLPDADALFTRIKSHSSRTQTNDDAGSFFHQVLSTAQLNTSGIEQMSAVPGGIIQVGNDPSYSLIGAMVDVEMVKFHELWVQDEEDYTTIQIIEPDILIAPLMKKSNLLIPKSGKHPYTLIQPNQVQGYFWGRSEIADIIMPQALLTDLANDARRLMNLQVDKIISFQGFDGLTDERYDQMRAAGFFNGPPGANVTDLTPKFPPELLPFMEYVERIIDTLGGFENILAGRGDTGLRSGNHAETLLRTASPRLRDRSLLIERQCASAADLRLSIMEAKDGSNYWTDGSTDQAIAETTFRLLDVPRDRRVSVDSHSTSPIFADDHQNLIAFGVKGGFVDGISALEMLNFPQKDLLIQRYKENQAAKSAMNEKLMQLDPAAFAKAAAKGG